MTTKKPSIVDLMYRDFLRLAGEEVSHAKPVKKKPVVKSVVQKKKPVVKIVLNKTRIAPKVISLKPQKFKRTPKKKFVPMKPRRSTIDYPIGGVAQLLHPDERIPEAPDRGDTPVSSHWRHFDRDSGKPVAPWEVMMGPEYDDDDVDDDADPWDGMFRDEDYSYEDFETDWGGYDHQDTGYDDENA